jgi:hypothetical protein
MSEFTQVEKDIMLYAFNQWYRDNIGETTCEAIPVADRFNIYGTEGELIAFVYLYGGVEYFIKSNLYELWVAI